MMTEDEKTTFGPILEGLIDFSVGLMNQPKLLGVKSRFLCGQESVFLSRLRKAVPIHELLTPQIRYFVGIQPEYISEGF